MIDYFKWYNIKLRFDNTALREILFGSFTAITSAFFYRYTMINSVSADQSKIIDPDYLLKSALFLVLSAFFRYFGHFLFIHICPSVIQVHKDLDELLKKSKDTLVDADDWANVAKDQINFWNAANYSGKTIRFVIIISEALAFLFYLVAFYSLFRAVYVFLYQTIHVF